MAKSPVVAECNAKLAAALIGYDGPDPLKTLSVNSAKVKTELGPAIIVGSGQLIHLVRAWLEDKPFAVTVALCETGVHEMYENFLKLEKSSPGLVPKPFDYSLDQKLVFVEDLKGSESLQQQFDRCHVEKAAIQHLGHKLAAMHSNTHVRKVDQTEFHQMEEHFGIQHGRPFENEDQFPVLNELRSRKECLVHGNLNSSCILIKEYEAKVVGVGNIAIGSCAIDPAKILAHLIVEYHRHMLTPEDNDRHRDVSYKLVEAAKLFGDSYVEDMTKSLQLDQQYSQTVLWEVAVLCGAILLQMVSSGQYNHPQGLQEEVKQSAHRLLRTRQGIHNTDRLLNTALMLT